MRGISAWASFDPNFYLEHRKAGWAIEERMGFVKFFPHSLGGVIQVHSERGKHIEDALHAVKAAQLAGRWP
jgi:hypothetical protein